ncbi:hypothetical protein GUJ93_ZPchr0001g32357 [Zizania palustris]|uniref:Uncharacterized protein n=1 Tax=Zizania palustris TaxID=103762 RepID=A0A8J5RYV4_ZIZPA|nr:hypothetical protein GUJ93_ZPchr0001g32357 [Zizania palustris]
MLLVSLAIFGCFAVLAHAESADGTDSDKMKLKMCSPSSEGNYCCYKLDLKKDCYPDRAQCLRECCKGWNAWKNPNCTEDIASPSPLE